MIIGRIIQLLKAVKALGQIGPYPRSVVIA